MDDQSNQDEIAAVLAADDDVEIQPEETEGAVESPEPAEAEEVEAPAEDAQDDAETDETEAETEAPPEGEQEDNAESESEEEDEQVDPKEEARRRYEERQRHNAERRAQLQEQNREYIEAGEDEYDQRLRNMEVNDHARTIEANESQLLTEFERAKANPELQIFNPENTEQFNQKLYDKALRDYNAGYLAYDKNDNLIQVKGSLYEHLKETAEIYTGAVKSGQVKQVRATRKMRSASDSKPAAPQKQAAVDPILEALMSD